MSSRRFVAPAIVLGMALCLALSACGGAADRKARHLENGREFLAADNFEKARVEFRNALQIDPNDADARFLHGRALEKLGNLREAAGMYQAAIDSNADHLEARANLGRVFVFAGAPDRALEYVEPGLAKAPKDPELLTVRAAIKAQRKDPEGAMADARAALAQNPKNENAIALLAALHRQRGEPAEAAEILEKAIANSPGSVELRQVLASLYLSLEEFDKAEAQFKEILKLKPRDLPAYYQLAIHHTNRKNLDAADRVLRAAIQADKESEQPLITHAEFVANWRGGPEGIKTLERYVSERPKNLELRLGLGALQQRLNRTDDAISTYRAVIEADDTGAQGLTARNRIAAILVTRGKTAEASELVEQVLRENPRDNDALVLRGNLAMDARNPAAAVADLRAVLRDQPESIGVLRALARAHVANREPALAEEHLRQAMTIAPTDVATRLELAALLGQTARVDQALPLLEETVRANPNNVNARETLVRAYIANSDLPAAKVAIRDLMTLAPNFAPGYYFAGLLAQASGDLDEAEKQFSKAFELSPDAGDALAAVTRIKVQRGQSAAAEALVKRTIESRPKDAIALNLLGELLVARTEFGEAKRLFAQASELAPRWWLPYRNLAYAHLQQKGDTALAIAAFKQGIDRTGETPLIADLAALYERIKQPNNAIQLYEDLVAREPRSEVGLNNLAMLLVTYRTDAASLDRARTLTASFANSNSPQLLDTHGWVLVQRGQYAEALPILERANALAPDSPIVRYHLAMAQLRAGQTERARDNLQQVLQGKPVFAGVDQARQALASLTGATETR
jgi:tetratricopeptide (TPR) repeat protein